MFTGIIKTVGVVRRAVDPGGTCRLEIAPSELAADVRPGDSVSINGVCLTVAELCADVVGFDVIPETLSRSNLGRLRVGARVNVERSLQAGDRLDGHFVQGHIDGTARVERVDRQDGEHRVWMSADPQVTRYVVPKGSVTLDGVSLTVADLEPGQFSVALIPTTLRETTLGEWQVGDTVNVETDILVRSVAHLLESFRAGGTGGVTMNVLREHGFVESIHGERGD